MSKSALLRELLNSPDTLVMPDAYDPLSARIIERLGFKAVQCSGYSTLVALRDSKDFSVILQEKFLCSPEDVSGLLAK